MESIRSERAAKYANPCGFGAMGNPVKVCTVEGRFTAAFHSIILPRKPDPGMKTTDNENLDSAWHTQILSDCDDILRGLTRVIGNLRKQRRYEFRTVRRLEIFKESWASNQMPTDRYDLS